MRTTSELAWRLLRGGGRGSLLGSLLTAAAVAVCAGLLMFALGVNHAFAQRADADAWRRPAPEQDTSTQGSSAQGGSAQGGPAQGGPAQGDSTQGGSGQDGAGRGGSGQEGSGQDGTTQDGSGQSGTARDGTGQGGSAVEALSTDYVRGKPISVVDLAATGEDPPVPPGMDHFPEPGEVVVSPALAELLRRLPADQLAGRFPAEPSGVLGQRALIHPGELVAVVGRAPNDPVMTTARDESMGIDAIETPQAIDGYATGAVSSNASTYQILALIATVLMVVPLLIFGGAAARLTVARRDQRLAALRLVGATPGQVVQITVIEAVLTAVAGTIAGTLLYAAAIPALAHIPIGGGVWFTGDLWPAWWQVAAALAGVPLLIGVSAVVGLRRVVVTPLGVAARVTPPAMKAVRMLVFVAVLVVFGVVASSLTRLGTTGVVILLIMLTLAFLSVNLVGPWVVGLIGRFTARVARRPSRLLAGRRLRDDPRAAWRTVAGVALTGFVAGFLCLMNPADMFSDGPRDRLEISVPASRAPAVAAEARKRLDGTDAKVAISEGGEPTGPEGGTPEGSASGGGGPGGGASEPAAERIDTVQVTVPGGAAALDRARTALAGTLPGMVPISLVDVQDRNLLADVRTGSLTVLVVSFLIAITSAGITAASAVLDRRSTYAALRLMGTPLSVLDRARRQETLIPLTVLGGGSVLTGLFFAAPFAVGFGAAGAVTLLAFVALGFAGVLGATALSRPLLNAVTRDPAPQGD